MELNGNPPAQFRFDQVSFQVTVHARTGTHNHKVDDPHLTTSCPQTNLWPIEEKESDRWLKGYRRVCELAVACPETQIVMVADREGDIYDIFVEAQEGELPPVNDNYYLARWAVEISFRILKTGWRVEDIQLETMHRLKNCLALYCIIAWRVQYLTYLNPTSPALKASAYQSC